MIHNYHRRLILGLVGVLLSGSLSCSGDTTDPHSLPPAQTFWTLQFPQHAVNLALTAPAGQPVEDTLHLVATGRNLLGQSLAGVVQYHSIDSTVTVDSTGLVTARYVTSTNGTAVIASQTVRGTTLVDTAFVQVTDSALPLPLATFVLRAVSSSGAILDSAKEAVDRIGTQVMVFATMATGSPATDTVCNATGCPLLVRISSSDSSIATVDAFGDVTPILPGHVTFYVTTWAYGVAKRDSLPFVIGYPLRNSVTIGSARPVPGRTTPVLYFAPDTNIIGVKGGVAFKSVLATPIDIVFDSTQQSDISIQPFRDVTFPNAYTMFPFTDTTGTVFVIFLAVGTYHYHSHLFGTGGTIVVSAGP